MSTPVPTVQQPRSYFWRSVLEAVRGTHQDFTAGPISRAIFLLATPMVLEMLMESLFAIVDMFWVTRLGANAVATIGLTESMLTIVFSIAFGVSMSTTAMVARRIGEKDTAGATTAGAQSILLGGGIALVMGLPGVLFAPQLLALMGGSPQLVVSGQHYTAVAFGSSLIIMLLFLNNAILRGAGDAAAAMRVLWLSNIINLVLDPCFIFGLGPFPKLGVTGAAVSTLIGRSFGVLYQFWLLARGSSRITIRFADLRVVPRVIRSLARVSATGIAQFAVGQTSWIVLVRMVSSFGAAAVAGYAIGIRVFLFVLLPSWGLSGAAATMVGQNLGAGKPERAERAVYLTGFYNMLFLGLVSLIFIAAPHIIVDRFTTDIRVAPYAVDFLRIIAFGNLAYAFGMVMVQALNGAGDTVTPTVINIIGYWFIEVPLAYLLAFRWNMQARGVFITVPTAQLVITLISLAVFVRGGWKRRTI